MNKVYIVGVGPGAKDYLAPVAKKIIEESDCLIAGKRHMEQFADKDKEKIYFKSGHFDEIFSYIKKNKARKKIAVLVSGDPGLYSFLGRISDNLKKDEYIVIPGISSLQVAFSKIGELWQDAEIVSIHGRPKEALVEKVKNSKKVFLLADENFSPDKIAAHLLENGIKNRRAIVFENLSYPDERVVDTDLEKLRRLRGFGLCAMIIKEDPRFSRETKKGRLYGIGIGPGDPKLITLKALEILEKADIVFAPKTSYDGESLARSIIGESVPNKKFIELTFPMTKDKKILKLYWKKAAFKIAGEIKKEKLVAFITIGDPMIYSTYIYLLKTLNRYFPSIKTQTIPGISAFNAAASRAGIPLVEGNEKMAILPVTKGLFGIEDSFRKFDRVVLMKVGSKLAEVVELLKKNNLLKNSILVSRAGHPDEKIVYNISSMKDKKLGYLSVIIVKCNPVRDEEITDEFD